MVEGVSLSCKWQPDDVKKAQSSLSGWKQQGGLCLVLYHTAPDECQTTRPLDN